MMEMTMAADPSRPLGPGEVRSRQRRRRQIAYIAFAGFVGGVIGLATGFFDRGEGDLFAGGWDKLVLDPLVAIVIAALLLFGFAVLPLWGFTQIDELKREHNLVSFTGGCIAVLSGFPVWAVLSAGGFVPPPHPFGVWMIGFVAMSVSYLYARWRS